MAFRLTKSINLFTISCGLSATFFLVITEAQGRQSSRNQNIRRGDRIQRPPEPPFVNYGAADKAAKISSAIGKAGKLFNEWVFDRVLDTEVETVQKALQAKARRNGARLPDGELYQKVVYVDPFGYRVAYQLRFIGSGPTIKSALQNGRNTPGLEPAAPDLLVQKGSFVFWGPGPIGGPIYGAPDLSDLYGQAIEDFIAEQREQIQASTASGPVAPTRPPHDPHGGPDPQRGGPGRQQGPSRGGPQRDLGTGGAEVAPGGRLPLLALGGRTRIITGQIPQRITEFGTPNGRKWADFNGDGNPDLCVVLFDIPELSGILVTLSTGPQFEQRAAGAEIVSRGSQVGLPDGRDWVDFNKDKKADYCRVVGTQNDYHLRVTLSAGDRFGTTLPDSEKIDPGIKETRAWVDWDGDGFPDFVRVVERPGFHRGIAITFGSGSGFGPTLDNLTPNSGNVEIAGVRPEDLPRFLNIFDTGYPEATLWMDVNGDGKADYIRLVGSNKDLVSVTLSNGRGFGLTITEPLPTRAIP